MRPLLPLLFAASLPAAAVTLDPAWGPMPEGVRLDTAPDGSTLFRYALAPDTPVLNGRLVRLGKDVDLFFRESVPATDFDRPEFEASGLVLDDRDIPAAIELRPVVRDAGGEVFDFLPDAAPSLLSRRGGWALWRTGHWFSGEAGAASHGLCTVSGAPGNGRPDGALELLGFRLHIVRPAAQPDEAPPAVPPETPVEGIVRLGAIRAISGRVPFAEPFFYADAACGEPGRYRLVASVADDFQGDPVRGIDRAFDWSPGARIRLDIPAGPDGIHWIDWTLTGPDGARVAGGSFRHQTLGAPAPSGDGSPVPAAGGGSPALALAPSIGGSGAEPPVVVPPSARLRISAPNRGVFAPGEPLRFRVAAGGEGAVRWSVTPYQSADVLASGDVPADGALELPADLPSRGTQAFRLKVRREAADGRVLDAAEFLFGDRTDPAAAHPRAGDLPDRRDIKRRPYHRMSYVCLSAKAGERPMDFYARDFRDTVSEWAPWVRHWTVCPDLNDFAILPGVYDFAMLDAWMDAAADMGVKLTVRFAHTDGDTGPYRQGAFSGQFSHDGTPSGAGLSYGTYAGSDPALAALWLGAYRALFDRYGAHTAFEGYYLMHPAGEWTVADRPWAGVIAGYSPVEAAAFRDWLRARYGAPAALAAAWGLAEAPASWDAVEPPAPAFRDGPAPDLRPAWADFSLWKESLKRSWTETLARGIRAFDDRRILIAYGPPAENRFLDGVLDYGHNGGNHDLNHRGEYEAGWLEGGIGWITEPVSPHGWAADNVPGKGGWTIDASVWTMLAQAGAGGANLHIYTFDGAGRGAVARQGGFHAFDRMERFGPLLREAHAARLVARPSDIAVVADAETLHAKHRTTFAARLADLRRWLDLARDDGFQPADLAAFPDRAFKLVLPNVLDEVVAPGTLDLVVRAVRERGALVVLTARTGRFVAGDAAGGDFRLLRALGIEPPAGPWVAEGDIAARALPGDPLFGDGRAIPFQTLSRLRRELHDPAVAADFNHYPYRWLPETDYFGAYTGEHPAGGEVLAEFPGGGAAATLHRCGAGRAIVFWGLPSLTGGALRGLVASAARLAGVEPPDAEVPDAFEMHNDALGRHYGVFYREEGRGLARVRFPSCPDGAYYADEMLADRKLGLVDGRALREEGLLLDWPPGESPLKAVRLIPANAFDTYWKSESANGR